MAKPHEVQIYLAPEIRSAIIKYMSAHDLDKQFACQCLIVKQLYQEQRITKEVYEFYLCRYSKTISSLAEHEPVKPSLEATMEQQRKAEKTRQFSMVLDQWSIHGVEWRSKWILEAEKYKDQIAVAKLVLDLGGKQQ